MDNNYSAQSSRELTEAQNAAMSQQVEATKIPLLGVHTDLAGNHQTVAFDRGGGVRRVQTWAPDGRVIDEQEFPL